MGLFSMMASLGLDTSSYHSKMRSAEQASKNASRNISRAFTMLIGENILRATVQGVRSLGDSGEEIRKKFRDAGLEIEESVVTAIIAANKQWDVMGLKIKSALAPIVGLLAKAFGAFHTGVATIAQGAGATWARITGTATPEGVAETREQMLRQFTAEENAMQDAVDRARIFGDDKEKDKKEKFEDIAQKTESYTQRMTPFRERQADALARIGGFTRFAGAEDAIAKRSLAQLEGIKRNTDSLKVRR